MIDFVKRQMNIHKEAILYVICGGFTTLVNWGSYAVFVWANINPNISNVLSWIVSVLFAFAVNKWIVFESKNHEATTVARELSMFVSARILTLVVAAILFFVLHDMAGLQHGVTLFTTTLFGTEGMYTKIITSVVEIALNWVFSKYFVFKKTNAPGSI